MKTSYLGDGGYATFDHVTGYVWLDCRGQTEMSISPSGQPGIAIESQTWKALTRFVAECSAECNAETK